MLFLHCEMTGQNNRLILLAILLYTDKDFHWNFDSIISDVVFQETVRQKDQSIRKYEQEIDSLQFRNDQVRQGKVK